MERMRCLVVAVRSGDAGDAGTAPAAISGVVGGANRRQFSEIKVLVFRRRGEKGGVSSDHIPLTFLKAEPCRSPDL